MVIAAGKGTRLKGHGDLKSLVKLCDMPMIERVMHTAAAAGVRNFFVVTGYRGDILYHHLESLRRKRSWSITTINNPDFEKENGLSVLLGENFIGREFFLTMCDHMVEISLYKKLLAADLSEDTVGLGVDRHLSNPDVDIDDVTKVLTEGGHITDIGKTLKTYNAFDTGVFRARPALFAAIRQSWRESGDCSISGGMKVLAKSGKAAAIDVSGSRWIDVDNPEMHDRADEWLRMTDGASSLET